MLTKSLEHANSKLWIRSVVGLSVVAVLSVFQLSTLSNVGVAAPGLLQMSEQQGFFGTDFESCMRQQESKQSSSSSSLISQAQRQFWSFPPLLKNTTMTLTDAFTSNHATIFFLHQRKAAGSSIREILFNKYMNIVGMEEARRRSFVPCFTHGCPSFELPIYETNFLGEKKLIASHMSYHTPFARAIFDDTEVQSVFITNIREPLSRIKSCMFYRYPDKINQTLSATNFSVELAEEVFLKTKDKFNSTCVQEPFRILSPFDPDKEPVSQQHINQICCFVRSSFHVIDQFQRRSNKTMSRTVIESELLSALENITLNENPMKFRRTPLQEARWNQFEAYLRNNPFVQAEMSLYDCISDS